MPILATSSGLWKKVKVEYFLLGHLSGHCKYLKAIAPSFLSLFSYSMRLFLLFYLNSQFLINFILDREAVGVPSEPSLNMESTPMGVASYNILKKIAH